MTKEILIKAREIYAAAPSHAAPGEWPEEGTHCMVTAVAAGAGSDSWLVCFPILDVLWREIGVCGPVEYNATHTTEEVLAVFDRAIGAA